MSETVTYILESATQNIELTPEDYEKIAQEIRNARSHTSASQSSTL